MFKRIWHKLPLGGRQQMLFHVTARSLKVLTHLKLVGIAINPDRKQMNDPIECIKRINQNNTEFHLNTSV